MPRRVTMHNNPVLQFSIKRPKFLIWGLALITLLLSSLISMVQVDTDPENMLSENEPVRVFHNLVKKEFSLSDVVVLGVVNEQHENGVFNPATLKHIEILTTFALELKSESDPAKHVVAKDLLALGNTETIEQAGPGQVRFEWLMKTAPTTDAEALAIRDKALTNPLHKGTLVSEDGKAVGIYIPITAKDFAAEVRKKLLEKIETFGPTNDKFYITGLPVAEDTFGQEMFIQMAISAPLAMLAIFLLMLLFFKKLRLIISPMIVAMTSVLCTMGLFIGSGHTLHIMSSMIPIFLMPIAVVDSIHILSEFFDSYQSIKDRRKTLEQVMGHLFMPMLYTSLTSAAGFASLALTPIPPVQAFGIFVALGIMLAWLITILFVPAYIMLMDEKQFENFGAPQHEHPASNSFLSRMLHTAGTLTYRKAKSILVLTGIIVLISAYGISKITINDNPINWFTENHAIRVADKVLNSHFGGTYEAFLVLSGTEQKIDNPTLARQLQETFQNAVQDFPNKSAALTEAQSIIAATLQQPETATLFLDRVSGQLEEKLDSVGSESYDLWAELLASLEQFRDSDQIFKRPDVLLYIEALQNRLLETGKVGKSNSLTDVVKKIHQELFESDPAYYRIPDSINAVAQCLISFQSSHKPDDLWHLVTPDYKKANLWIQLKNGDNQVMEAVVREIESFMAENPPPVPLQHNWAGLTYINVKWQEKMVSGMRDSFLGSFVIVLIMMTLLFRSPLWGLLAMVPLSVTIVFIYGVIGLVGKDYDMPVAVLSSLALGLAVDFAIHFLERARSTYKKCGSWKEAAKSMFEEPARAITRNVIVIAVGFTPLLAAPLIPYQTVGILLASIMAVSGIGTMLILPALLTIFEQRFFAQKGLE